MQGDCYLITWDLPACNTGPRNLIRNGFAHVGRCTILNLLSEYVAVMFWSIYHCLHIVKLQWVCSCRCSVVFVIGAIGNCQWHRQLCHASCLPQQRRYIFDKCINHPKIWNAFFFKCFRKPNVREKKGPGRNVKITPAIPTNLGSFSQVPVFHGISPTESSRTP